MSDHLDLLIYLDDILVHARGPAELLQKLCETFLVCKKNGLELNSRKCKLATEEVQFCGRIINKNGAMFNQRQYEALVGMQAPTVFGSLVELVRGANWKRNAISQFSLLIASLHDLLESEYKLNKTRKKTRLANRPI